MKEIERKVADLSRLAAELRRIKRRCGEIGLSPIAAFWKLCHRQSRQPRLLRGKGLRIGPDLIARAAEEREQLRFRPRPKILCRSGTDREAKLDH